MGDLRHRGGTEGGTMEDEQVHSVLTTDIINLYGIALQSLNSYAAYLINE